MSQQDEERRALRVKDKEKFEEWWVSDERVMIVDTMHKHSAWQAWQAARRAPEHEKAAPRAEPVAWVHSCNADGVGGPLPMKELVDRFLRWPLPLNVQSDEVATIYGRANRCGSNLLDARQARMMLEFVLAPPSSTPPASDERNKQTG